jgi:hypothetical protein
LVERRQDGVEHLQLTQVALLPGGRRPRRAAARQQVPQRDVLGDQLGTGDGQRADDLGERQVRQRGLRRVEAAAHQHGETGSGSPLDRLRHEPGLAHPGVAGHQQPGGPAGGGAFEGAGERGHLVPAPHQLDTDPQPRHIGHRDTAYRRSAWSLRGAAPGCGGSPCGVSRRLRRVALRTSRASRKFSASARSSARWCSERVDMSAKSANMTPGSA